MTSALALSIPPLFQPASTCSIPACQSHPACAGYASALAFGTPLSTFMPIAHRLPEHSSSSQAAVYQIFWPLSSGLEQKSFDSTSSLGESSKLTSVDSISKEAPSDTTSQAEGEEEGSLKTKRKLKATDIIEKAGEKLLIASACALYLVVKLGSLGAV